MTAVVDRVHRLGEPDRKVVRLGAVLVGLVLVEAVLSAIEAQTLTPALAQFERDREFCIASGFQALLLIGAFAVGAYTIRSGAMRGRAWFAVGLLGYMGLDEWFTIHESLQGPTGMDWQVLYAPIFLFAGISGLALLVDLRPQRASAALLALGGFLWVASQTLEALEWNGDARRGAYGYLASMEELLEPLGTVLLLLAFYRVLVLYRAHQARLRQADQGLVPVGSA